MWTMQNKSQSLFDLSLGEKIRLARQKAGLKQSAVAKALDIHCNTMIDIEHDRRVISFEQMCKLSEITGVPLIEFQSSPSELGFVSPAIKKK